MFAHTLRDYAEYACDRSEVGVAVYSVESGRMVALSFDAVADINEYGQLIISIEIEP